MDCITYLLDPAEPMTMVNIITHHTCFTTDIVKLAAPVQEAKYNLYDCANDRAARLALVDCFDDALHLEIEEHLPNDPTFHILWMMFVQIVQSDSMGKFTQMTNEIKQQTTQMYAGQNIAEMALAISTCATALSTAVFEYAPKERNFQIMTASRPRAVLDLRTATPNKLTNNQ